ncbi:MAG: biotin/lipoyl-containing protein, partial [Woeseia sp.]
MSEYIFKLPDLGEGTVESEIGEWHISVGDDVAEEDIVATMMTDKAAVEISSPVSGKVKSLPGEPGDVVAVGSPLIIFETDAAAASEAPDSGPEKKAQKKAGKKPKEKKPKSTERADNKTRVMTSPAIRRKAKEAGIDLTQIPGTGTGGRILRTDFDEYIEKASDSPSTATRRQGAE